MSEKCFAASLKAAGGDEKRRAACLDESALEERKETYQNKKQKTVFKEETHDTVENEKVRCLVGADRAALKFPALWEATATAIASLADRFQHGSNTYQEWKART